MFIRSDTSTGFLKWYVLTFVIIGLLAYAYRTLLGGILIRRYSYYVDDVFVDGGNVTQLQMRPVKIAMNFKPGQFIFVRFLYGEADKITTEWHPFSISSAPKDDYLRISVKALGDYTRALTDLKKGAIAEVEGAYGRFSYTHYRNANQIWIAGGIGITPFISMACSLPDTGYKIDLYYSVKTRSELVDIGNLIVQMQLKPDVLRIIPYIGDEEKTHISATYINEKSASLVGKDIFICGPPSMMKSLRVQFKKAGVTKSMIHTEEFAMS